MKYYIFFLFSFALSLNLHSQINVDSIQLNDGSNFYYSKYVGDSSIFDLRDTSMRNLFFNKPLVNSLVRSEQIDQIIQKEMIEIETLGGTNETIYLLDKVLINGEKYNLLYYHFNTFSGCVLLTNFDDKNFVLASFGQKILRVSSLVENGIIIRETTIYDQQTLESTRCYKEQLELSSLTLGTKEYVTSEKCKDFGALAVPDPDLYSRRINKQIRNSSPPNHEITPNKN